MESPSGLGPILSTWGDRPRAQQRHWFHKDTLDSVYTEIVSYTDTNRVSLKEEGCIVLSGGKTGSQGCQEVACKISRQRAREGWGVGTQMGFFSKEISKAK